MLLADPGGTRGISLRLDRERRFHLGREYRRFDLLGLMDRLRRGRLLPPIVLSASPELAITSLVPVRLDRENPKDILGAVEFENVLGQTVTRVFNDERSKASAILSEDDLDTILVGVRARNFQVDGKTVIDPLGLPGKKITAILELTFVVRSLFEKWRNFFNADRGFFFTTETYALASALERTGTRPAIVLAIGSEESHCVYLGALRGVPVLSGGPISWSEASLRQSIKDRWRVGDAATADILGKYAAHAMSNRVREDLDAALHKAFGELSKELGRHRVRGDVYVTSRSFLPVPLPHKAGTLNLLPFRAAQVLEPLGLELADPSGREDILFNYLAPFLEFYYDTSNSRVNHWLRRRVHWFTPVREADGRMPV